MSSTGNTEPKVEETQPVDEAKSVAADETKSATENEVRISLAPPRRRAKQPPALLLQWLWLCLPGLLPALCPSP